jgi:hypothetical protein
MSNAEAFCWFGVGWCFFWGVRSTTALMSYRKARRPPPTRVLAFTGVVIVLQVVGLAMFLSAALWMRTTRELGL